MNWTMTVQVTTMVINAVEELFSDRTQEEIAEIFDLGQEVVSKSMLIGTLIAGITERVVLGQLDPLLSKDLKERGLSPHPSSGGKVGILAETLYQALKAFWPDGDRGIAQERELLKELINQAIDLAEAVPTRP